MTPSKTFTTEERPFSVEEFPGLERHAVGVFGIPYAELVPKQQAAIRRLTAQQTGEETLAALRGLKNLTDQDREGALIFYRADHKPITNGDQDVIDRAYIAAEAAVRKAEGRA